MLSPAYDPVAKTLSVTSENIAVFNIGTGNTCAIISSASQNVGLKVEPAKVDVSAVDRGFLASCSVHLGREMVTLAEKLLNEVRRHHTDRLVEGKCRKWTSEPSNFFAITIQNRNQKFLVSIKGNPTTLSYRTLNLKRSRSPYCEFYLNSLDQIPDAVQAILQSASYR